MREKLQSAPPLWPEEKLKAYAARQIPSIDVSKLVYFAGSIFWRASLRAWNLGRRKTNLISLGSKYEKEFRRYLIGESEFPRNAAMLISISDKPEPFRAANFPAGGRSDGYHIHRFAIPGVIFRMAVGKDIPAITRRTCTARSAEGFIVITDDVDEDIMRDMMSMLNRSRPARKLIESAVRHNPRLEGKLSHLS